MEILNVEVNDPIPSLPVHKVKFSKDGKWSYIYTFNSEVKLTTRKLEKPLYFKDGLVSMHLIKKNPTNTTNLEVSSITELRDILDQQRKSDIAFRKKFKEEHKDEMDNYTESIFVLDNKTQVLPSDTYIVRSKRKNKETTVFVGRC